MVATSGVCSVGAMNATGARDSSMGMESLCLSFGSTEGLVLVLALR